MCDQCQKYVGRCPYCHSPRPRAPQALGWTHDVVKRHKRLHIVRRESGEMVYTPPDFIKLHSREPLQALARNLTAGADRITAVVAFETAQSTGGKRP